MRVVESVPEWQTYRAGLSGTVGFVPTMGALHAGHASLIERSLRENDHTVVSLFVNPTQFNDPKDYTAYPKTWDSDRALLEGLGEITLLAPRYEELYPDGYRYKVVENEDSKVLCGAHRPGHFDGVLSVVMKLLQLTRPTRAYFGEKDYQQLRLIQGMVAAYFLPVEIVPCPVVREEDGLAMSSRNTRLTSEEREIAPVIFEALTKAANVGNARARMEAMGLRVDYVEERWGRRLAAAHLGHVRLIDNVKKQNGAR